MRDDVEESSNTKCSEHTKKGKGKSKPQGCGKAGRSNEQKPRHLDMSKVKCYNYNEMDNFAKDCCDPNKREIKVNLVKQKDEHPSRLMAKVCDLMQTMVVNQTRRSVCA